MKLDYLKLNTAIALAKRQRANGTEYTLNAVTLGDVEELIKRAKIVDDLAARDPVVHHEVDYGQSDAYTCGACGVEIVGDVAHYISDPTKFPHAVTCPWRRAKELTT